MSERGALLAWLRQQVGYVEAPGNRTRYAHLAGHRDGQPWCATFLVAGARAVGLELPRGAESAYTPTMEAAFAAEGRLHPAPQVGDFFFLYFTSLRRVAHVGVVTSVSGDVISTIEGNTNAAGSRTGGLVAARTRNWRRRGTAYVKSFGRPDYAGSVALGSRLPSALLKHQEDDVTLSEEDVDRIVARMWGWPIPGWNGSVPAYLRLAGADQRANEMASKVAELHTAGYLAAVARAVAHEMWIATKVKVAHLDPTRDGQELNAITALGRSASVVANLARDTLIRVRHPEPGHDGETQDISVGNSWSRAAEATEVRQVGVIPRAPQAAARVAPTTYRSPEPEESP